MAKSVVLQDAEAHGGAVTITGTVDGVEVTVVLPVSRFAGAGTKAQRQAVAADALIEHLAQYGTVNLPLAGTISRGA